MAVAVHIIFYIAHHLVALDHGADVRHTVLLRLCRRFRRGSRGFRGCRGLRACGSFCRCGALRRGRCFPSQRLFLRRFLCEVLLHEGRVLRGAGDDDPVLIAPDAVDNDALRRVVETVGAGFQNGILDPLGGVDQPVLLVVNFKAHARYGIQILRQLPIAVALHQVVHIADAPGLQIAFLHLFHAVAGIGAFFIHDADAHGAVEHPHRHHHQQQGGSDLGRQAAFQFLHACFPLSIL